MKEIVRSACPGCQRPLTIPADWTGRTVRCKHCRHTMDVRRRVAVPVAARAASVPIALTAPMPVAPLPTWEPIPATNGHLPEYAPIPVAAVPQARYVTAFDAAEKYAGRGRYRGPKNRGWIKYAVFGLLFLSLAGGAVALGYYRPGLFKSMTPPEPGGEGPAIAGVQPGETPAPVPAASGTFPRRMLAISIHSYLYANPLHNGDSGFAADENRRTGTDAAISRLAERWRIPKEQLYHLTDAPLLEEKRRKAEPKAGAGKKDAAEEMPAKKGEMAPAAKRLAKVPPLKSVVEGTITRFLDASREQDRIVLVFCGHVMEKKGEVFLLPLEGDLEEVESLIPLKWVYEKLGACKAQEKLVIWDVARFHPERGIERPYPGAMNEAMETALHDSPAGVSVVTTCSKGEQSLEMDYLNTRLTFDTPGVKGSGIDLRGGLFLSLIHGASLAGALSPEKKLPASGDELPVERMTTWMSETLGEIVKSKFKDRTQTVKATIKKRGDAVAFNASELMPGRFEYPAPPPSADPKAVVSIMREIQLPPVKPPRVDAPATSISDVLPFSEESLKSYLTGELRGADKPTEFQKAIEDAVIEIRGIRQAGSGTDLPEEFASDTPDKAKEDLRKVQEIPAKVEGILQDHLDKLELMADQKEKQPKRWQAHYDYIVAELKLRICYANQYNLALANVRGGKLPDLKDGQNGFRLTAETTLDKNTPSNYKDMFNEARKSLLELGKQHPNTPWALLAKSDRTVAIGLRLTGSSVGATK
jgi:hypothetical protein